MIPKLPFITLCCIFCLPCDLKAEMIVLNQTYIFDSSDIGCSFYKEGKGNEQKTIIYVHADNGRVVDWTYVCDGWNINTVNRATKAIRDKINNDKEIDFKPFIKEIGFNQCQRR